MQLSPYGLLLLTQPLHSSEQHTRANLEFSSNFGIHCEKINVIQIGYLEFRTNSRSFRVIILVFRTLSHYLNSKTEFGPGLEQFQQIRTILRFLDPI